MVKGVRHPREQDDGTRVVTFEKCGWKLTHAQIDKWASYYGTTLTKVTEAEDDDLDPDVKPDDNKVGCGNLRVTVKLRKPIPQFLPMFGYKVRVFYKDITRVCTNCYQAGHLKRECQNQSKSWLHHVVDFITDNEHIEENDFGYWMRKSRELIRDNPEMFDCPEQEMDDLDIDSDDSEVNDSDFAEARSGPQSPNVITTDPITSVSHVIENIETNNKTLDKNPLPTEEKRPRGHPKNKLDPSDVTKKTKK